MDVLHSNKNNKKIKFNNKNIKIQTENIWIGSLRMQTWMYFWSLLLSIRKVMSADLGSQTFFVT